MSLPPSPSSPFSTQLSRRRFLQAGGIGALTMGMPGMVAARHFAIDRPFSGTALFFDSS